MKDKHASIRNFFSKQTDYQFTFVSFLVVCCTLYSLPGEKFQRNGLVNGFSFNFDNWFGKVVQVRSHIAALLKRNNFRLFSYWKHVCPFTFSCLVLMKNWRTINLKNQTHLIWLYSVRSSGSVFWKITFEVNYLSILTFPFSTHFYLLWCLNYVDSCIGQILYELVSTSKWKFWKKFCWQCENLQWTDVVEFAVKIFPTGEKILLLHYLLVRCKHI